MGRLVENGSSWPWRRSNELDAEKAKAVSAADRAVNRNTLRHRGKCFSLIVTQQPAARDLRHHHGHEHHRRPGAHGRPGQRASPKVVPRLIATPVASHRPNWRSSGEMVAKMLQPGHGRLCPQERRPGILANQDDEVDALYARVFTQIMGRWPTPPAPTRPRPPTKRCAAREWKAHRRPRHQRGQTHRLPETGSLEEINVDRP